MASLTIWMSDGTGASFSSSRDNFLSKGRMKRSAAVRILSDYRLGGGAARRGIPASLYLSLLTGISWEPNSGLAMFSWLLYFPSLQWPSQSLWPQALYLRSFDCTGHIPNYLFSLKSLELILYINILTSMFVLIFSDFTALLLIIIVFI